MKCPVDYLLVKRKLFNDEFLAWKQKHWDLNTQLNTCQTHVKHQSNPEVYSVVFLSPSLTCISYANLKIITNIPRTLLDWERLGLGAGELGLRYSDGHREGVLYKFSKGVTFFLRKISSATDKFVILFKVVSFISDQPTQRSFDIVVSKSHL